MLTCQALPIVGEDFGEQTCEDAEVADGKDVDVDHVAQTMNNYRRNRHIGELVKMTDKHVKTFLLC